MYSSHLRKPNDPLSMEILLHGFPTSYMMNLRWVFNIKTVLPKYSVSHHRRLSIQKSFLWRNILNIHPEQIAREMLMKVIIWNYTLKSKPHPSGPNELSHLMPGYYTTRSLRVVFVVQTFMQTESNRWFVPPFTAYIRHIMLPHHEGAIPWELSMRQWPHKHLAWHSIDNHSKMVPGFITQGALLSTWINLGFITQGLLLLTWINLNPIMGKLSHAQWVKLVIHLQISAVQLLKFDNG